MTTTSKVDLFSWADQIAESCIAYKIHEQWDEPSDREQRLILDAVQFTLRALANPSCEGSAAALLAVTSRRAAAADRDNDTEWSAPIALSNERGYYLMTDLSASCETRWELQPIVIHETIKAAAQILLHAGWDPTVTQSYYETSELPHSLAGLNAAIARHAEDSSARSAVAK